MAWLDQRARAAALRDAATVQAARLAASEIARFLRHAEAIVSLGPQLVSRGTLDPDDDVNVAARLQALSGAGEIVVSQAVVARAGADGSFGAATEVWLKGMRAPMKVFRLPPQPPR